MTQNPIAIASAHIEREVNLAHLDEDIAFFEKKLTTCKALPVLAKERAEKYLALLREARAQYIASQVALIKRG